MITVYVPAEMGIFSINGAFDLGKFKIYPTEIEGAIDPKEGRVVWFEFSVDSSDEYEAKALARFLFLEYCALLSIFARHAFYEKRQYGYRYSVYQGSLTRDPPKLIKKAGSFTKIKRPWVGNRILSDPNDIPVPDDVPVLFKKYFSLSDEDRRWFLKISYCYQFALIMSDRYPVVSITAFIACLDKASEKDSKVIEDGEVNHKKSILKFLEKHCSIQYKEIIDESYGPVRSKFIHGADLGFEDRTYTEPDYIMYVAKKKLNVPLLEVYEKINRLEAIVSSSTVEWLVRNTKS